MLSIDHWKPDKMDYQGKGRFTLNRMVPRVVVTYCFELVKGTWRSSQFSQNQPKCFDSSAPVSTVNVLDVATFELFSADVDYEQHYAPEMNGGHSQDTVIWPFFAGVLPMHIKHDNVFPRGRAWDKINVEGLEIWSLDKSKLFSCRKRENAGGTFWDTDELVELVFENDWAMIRTKLVKMKLTEEDIEDLEVAVADHYKILCVLFKMHIVGQRSSR